MDVFQALIFSLVEGVTEFLPISSTGHLVLTSTLLHIPQTEFVKSFEIIIQLGAILAVVVLYWKRLLVSKNVILMILTSFIPTAILGLLFYKVIKEVLLGNPLVTVGALFFGGVALILIELLHKGKTYPVTKLEDISYKQALIIGLSQSVSMIPGVSRAAATIVGGLLLGVDRKTAVEYSFLLAVPTMVAATGLDVLKSDLVFSGSELMLLAVGFIGSFLVALVAIKLLLSFIQQYTFISFGIYRIILALLFWFFIL